MVSGAARTRCRTPYDTASKMTPSASREIRLLTLLSIRYCRSIALVRIALFRHLLTLLFVGSSAAAVGADLTVAVAANFAATFKTLAGYYQLNSTDTVRMSVGSSGKLYAQIVQGAPYDIFLSADSELPGALVNQQLALRDSQFTYAIGTLAVWNPRGELGDADNGGFDLSAVNVVALADPRHAPYGRAARQVLVAQKHWDRLVAGKQLAMAESVGQAWHYAASGNADVAFVALSQLRLARPTARLTGVTPLSAATQTGTGTDGPASPSTGETGQYWLPPQHLYAPLIQQGVILARSKNLAAARRFCAWMTSDPLAINTIHAAGYHTDTSAPK